MNQVVVKTRDTKYSKAVLGIIATLEHATNLEIHELLKKDFPEVTHTTVHRVTIKLKNSGIISEAPKNQKGATRYDVNTKPHDHFMCNSCGGIRDIDVSEAVIPFINQALGECRVTGRLVINGSCEKCIKKENI